MTLAIPVWLLWTLGGIAAVAGIAAITAVILFAWIGLSMSSAIGRGLGW